MGRTSLVRPLQPQHKRIGVVCGHLQNREKMPRNHSGRDCFALTSHPLTWRSEGQWADRPARLPKDVGGHAVAGVLNAKPQYQRACTCADVGVVARDLPCPVPSTCCRSTRDRIAHRSASAVRRRCHGRCTAKRPDRRKPAQRQPHARQHAQTTPVQRLAEVDHPATCATAGLHDIPPQMCRTTLCFAARGDNKAGGILDFGTQPAQPQN